MLKHLTDGTCSEYKNCQSNTYYIFLMLKNIITFFFLLYFSILFSRVEMQVIFLRQRIKWVPEATVSEASRSLSNSLQERHIASQNWSEFLLCFSLSVYQLNLTIHLPTSFSTWYSIWKIKSSFTFGDGPMLL